MTTSHITSAQRFAIFQIMDAAITISRRREHYVDVSYNGISHSLSVFIHRAGHASDKEPDLHSVFMQIYPGMSESENRMRVNQELAPLLDRLTDITEEGAE